MEKYQKINNQIHKVNYKIFKKANEIYYGNFPKFFKKFLLKKYCKKMKISVDDFMMWEKFC